MIAQSVGVDVLHLAAAALVGPLVDVLPLLVQLEVVPPAEPLLTYVASKLLTGVDSHVRLEVGVLLETFAANGARKGTFARVSTNMVLETGLPSEPLVAKFAFKRSFARVNKYYMSIDVGQMVERLCADVALKFLHSVYLLHCVR